MIDATWVFLQVLAGALGAVARFGVMAIVRPGSWHWGLFAVNSLGSLGAGAIVGAFSVHAVSWGYSAMVLAFAAGFTTFSTLTVDAAQYIDKREFRTGVVLVGSQVGVGVLLSAIGYISANTLLGAW